MDNEKEETLKQKVTEEATKVETEVKTDVGKVKKIFDETWNVIKHCAFGAILCVLVVSSMLIMSGNNPINTGWLYGIVGLFISLSTFRVTTSAVPQRVFIILATIGAIVSLFVFGITTGVVLSLAVSILLLLFIKNPFTLFVNNESN